jgi:hypothetical protein
MLSAAIAPRERKLETVLGLKAVHRVVDEDIAGGNVATWVAATPEGSILLKREAGTQEIYALHVKWPEEPWRTCRITDSPDRAEAARDVPR